MKKAKPYLYMKNVDIIIKLFSIIDQKAYWEADKSSSICKRVKFKCLKKKPIRNNLIALSLSLNACNFHTIS